VPWHKLHVGDIIVGYRKKLRLIEFMPTKIQYLTNSYLELENGTALFNTGEYSFKVRYEKEE
jgi:hypothetical protein